MFRDALLGEIRAELECSGLVMLAASSGMGKTTLLDDLARDIRAYQPERPIVRIDMASPEARAYREGRKRPLDELLDSIVEARRSSIARRVRATGDDGQEDGGQADASPHRRRPKFPSCCAEPTSRLLWTCIGAIAPYWAQAFSSGLARALGLGEQAPLVMVDGFSRSEGDEDEMDDLVRAIDDWRRAGARFVIASSPFDCLASRFPEGLRIGGVLLRVGAKEMPSWGRDLCISENVDLLADTRGIPALIDAARSAAAGVDLMDDVRFSASVTRLLAQNLAEPLSPEANRARIAIVLLGNGSIADLSEVGVHVKSDDLLFLASEFPLFGLDATSGTFACLATDLGRCGQEALGAARSYSQLTIRCLDLLARQGRTVRAAQVVCLLGESDATKAIGRNPGAYADAACDGTIVRSLKSPQTSLGVDEMTAAGLAMLGELRGIACGKASPCPSLADSAYLPVNLQPCADALAAARAVLKALSFCEDEGRAGTGAACRQGGVPLGPSGSTARWHRICREMSHAAVEGRTPEFADAWDELCDAADFSSGGLAASILGTFAVILACMCGQASRAHVWVGPLAARERVQRMGSNDPASVSDALLSCAEALSGFLCERPAATDACAGAVEAIGRARLFFEVRGMRRVACLMGCCEASCLLLSGRELDAEPLFGTALAFWTSHGRLVGQAAGSAGVAACELVRGAPAQARVYAHAAMGVAARIGAGPLGALAHMLDSIAGLRSDGAMASDATMLENSVRRSALAPQTSAFLEAEMAALHVGHGDRGPAADILQAPSMFATSYRTRIACLCARCLGRFASDFVELMPKGLKAEYASVCDDGKPADLSKPSAGVALLYGNGPRRPIRVEVFGGLRVTKNGYTIGSREWTRKTSRGLITLLALYPDRPFSRRELLDELWSDRPGIANRNNLSTALSALRKTLGQDASSPDYVLALGDAVMLNPDYVEVDVADFERASRMVLAHGTSKTAVELMEYCRVVEGIYGKGLIAENGCDGGIVARRSRELEETFIDCLLMGSQCALEVGSAPAALYFARAAARISPERGDVETAVIEALKAIRRLGLETVVEMDDVPIQAETPKAVPAACVAV